MSNREKDDGNTSSPEGDDRAAGDHDSGQAMQINENTIDDPEPVSDEDFLDKDLHSRRDTPATDQALQINENTIADKD